jgi:hypothetical protein
VAFDLKFRVWKKYFISWDSYFEERIVLHKNKKLAGDEPMRISREGSQLAGFRY